MSPVSLRLAKNLPLPQGFLWAALLNRYKDMQSARAAALYMVKVHARTTDMYTEQLRYVCKESCVLHPYTLQRYARTSCVFKDSCAHTVQSTQTKSASQAQSLLSFQLKFTLKTIFKTTSRPSDQITRSFDTILRTIRSDEMTRSAETDCGMARYSLRSTPRHCYQAWS